MASFSVILFLASPANGNPADCQEAVAAYKSAREDIATALDTYAKCLSDDDGHDDCSAEFETLKTAQDDFEDAVSKYETECN